MTAQKGGLLLYLDLTIIEGYFPIGVMNKSRKLQVTGRLYN